VHVPVGKPVSTFPGHALMSKATQTVESGINRLCGSHLYLIELRSELK
jgi:hypothetical protein